MRTTKIVWENHLQKYYYWEQTNPTNPPPPTRALNSNKKYKYEMVITAEEFIQAIA